MEEKQLVEKEEKRVGVFNTASSFELAQRQAKMLSQSALVPKNFQGKIADCVIALEIAQRTGASPLFVMQNLYIVHGKPSWSSQFVISAVNSCGKFSPIRYKFNDDKTECFAYAVELDTEEILEGPTVSIEMAKKEGWYQKNGSKWQTMPELMLRYRAASFFGRLYAPEILMGMKSTEEYHDIEPEKTIVIEPGDSKTEFEKMAEELKKEKTGPKSLDDIESSGYDINDMDDAI